MNLDNLYEIVEITADKLKVVLTSPHKRRCGCHKHGYVRLVFVNENGETMADYSFDNGNIATVPLVFKDADGNVLGIPSGLTVLSSDESVGTVAASADSGSVLITAVAPGTFVLTASVGSVSATLNVTVNTVIPPVGDLATIEFDTANATVAPIA